MSTETSPRRSLSYEIVEWSTTDWTEVTLRKRIIASGPTRAEAIADAKERLAGLLAELEKEGEK